MTRSAPLQASFARGELSPRALGRSDLQQYAVGLETCLNAVITPRGEFERRPGTRFVARSQSGGAVALLSFEASADEAYLIEAGEGYFRFFANRDLLHDAAGQPVVVTTPYGAEEVFALDWAQSADVLYLTHPNHPPQKLLRVGPDRFALEPVAFADGPYGPENSDPLCEVQHFSLGQKLIWNNCAPLGSGDVGRPVRVFANGRWLWDLIASVLSPSQASLALVGNIHIEAANFPLTARWRLGAFGAGNYPAHVVFHEDRLVFANSRESPQTLWISRSGDYENFAPEDASGESGSREAITVTLNDRQVNAIGWLLSFDNSLLVGTASGPWSINGGNDPGGLTAQSLRAFRQNAASAAAIRPVIARSSVLFAQRARRKLLALNPDSSFGRYVSPDLSVLSDHLLSVGLRGLDYQEEPYGLVWCLLEDGSLAGLTYNADEQLIAWHRHRLGGAGRAVSLRCLSGPRSQHVGGSTADAVSGDDLWLVVERQVAGRSEYHIEHLESFWGYGAQLADACFLDAAASYAGPPVTEVAGADHLEGAEVDALADGWLDKPAAPVSAGRRRLSRPAQRITIGHRFVTEGRLLDVSSGALNGAALSKPRHLYEAYFQLWESAGLHCGPDPAHLKEFQFRLEPGPEEQAVPTRSGWVRIARDEGGWERSTRLYWSQPWPLPLVVQSIALRLATSDE